MLAHEEVKMDSVGLKGSFDPSGGIPSKSGLKIKRL